MGRPATKRGTYEWRWQARMLARYLSVRDAGEGTPERREARRLEDRLLRTYEALVGYALGAQLPRVPINLEALAGDDDLRNAGLLGLLRALRTWQPERGAGFAGYAVQMVRFGMTDELRRLDGLSKHSRRQVTAAIRAAEAAERRTGRPTTEDEAAAEAGITPDRYRELVALDGRSRYVDPMPDHDGRHNPVHRDGPEGFDVGEVEIQKRAHWLLRYAGRKAAWEVAALYCSGEWGGVGQSEAWRNDRSVERGAGRISGVYDLPEAGGARVLVVTDLDAGTTGVAVDSMPAWVRDLMDGTGAPGGCAIERQGGGGGAPPPPAPPRQPCGGPGACRRRADPARQKRRLRGRVGQRVGLGRRTRRACDRGRPPLRSGLRPGPCGGPRGRRAQRGQGRAALTEPPTPPGGTRSGSTALRATSQETPNGERRDAVLRLVGEEEPMDERAEGCPDDGRWRLYEPPLTAEEMARYREEHEGPRVCYSPDTAADLETWELEAVAGFVRRHASGDWGRVNEAEAAVNRGRWRRRDAWVRSVWCLAGRREPVYVVSVPGKLRLVVVMWAGEYR